MTAFALLLVTMSALTHAFWNYLTKGSRDQGVFLWATGVAGSVLFLPAVAWLAAPATWSSRVWLGFGLGAVIRALYFLSLSAAYSRGDLSLVYPVARGIAPVLVPVAAAVFLGERLSLGGALGLGIVALGVYIVHLPGLTAADVLRPLARLGAASARYAVLTGVLTTTYSLVDKWNIAAGAPPLAYAYFTIPVAAMLLTPVVLGRGSGTMSELRAAGIRVPVVAVLMTSGYVMVLVALQSTQVSYVAPARELGIVFATILGCVALREGATPQRLTGASVIVLGVILLSRASS